MAKSSSNRQNLFPDAAVAMPKGFYSGDKANPKLRDFVEAHRRERPYDPEADSYGADAFSETITTSKNSAIFALHAYHLGKKPHDAIESYIRHYTVKGDLVLDPFCGSGSTLLAALLHGRKAIGIDVSPAATFISRFYVTQTNPDDLRRRFAEMERRVAPEMELLYGTRCHRCGGNATIHYVIYSNVYQCPRCLEEVSLFEASAATPACCPHCLAARNVQEPIHSDLALRGYKPVAVNFSCHGRCRPKRMTRSLNGAPEERNAFKQIDLPRIIELEAQPIPYRYPREFMMHVEDAGLPWGAEWRPSRNFRRVADLFTYRNLRGVAAMLNAAGDDDDLRAVITSGMLAVSRKAQHLDEGGGYIPGNWALPPMSKQRNVLESLKKVFQKTMKAKTQLAGLLDCNEVLLSTQSATDLSAMKANSVDYIFTDPPYGGAVQYGELNFPWETWLGFDTPWHQHEIVVNEVRGKALDDWAAMMRKAMAECFRVLKPGRWLTLCYHDTSEGTWELVQDIMAEAGFMVDQSERAIAIDTGGNTYNQRVADKVIKRDLVINFRKPKPGESSAAPVFIPADADLPTFRESARQVICKYLQTHPGSSKDRIYDDLVSSMMRAGQMQTHNFEELLREVADEDTEAGQVSRWYLKEAEETELDQAQSALEDKTAQQLARFIRARLEQDSVSEGVHFGDLWEHYVYTVKDKPRRHLDLLPDYFFKTLGGTWRLPGTPEEEELKARARQAGTNRRVRRFLALLGAGDDVPDRLRPSPSDLAEWIRHCQRSAMYDEGRQLYEKGQGDWLSRLSEEVVAGVEEDYQICLRALQRAAAPAGKKRGRKPGRKAKEENED